MKIWPTLCPFNINDLETALKAASSYFDDDTEVGDKGLITADDDILILKKTMTK